MSEEVAVKKDHKFQPGQSGNPKGRPKDSKNKKTARQIAEEMDFDPVEAAILLIKGTPAELSEKLKINDPISVTQKGKLITWVGDKMYASVKAIEMDIVDPSEGKDDNRVVMYFPQMENAETPQEIADKTGATVIEAKPVAVDVPAVDGVVKE